VRAGVGLIFEWDAEKARSNESRHGVSFEEASTVFGDALSVTIPDPLHSEAEDRSVTLGRSLRGVALVVAHTERGGRIWTISARPAEPRERRDYEAGNE